MEKASLGLHISPGGFHLKPFLGILFRMEQKRIPKKGLRWNPSGKRKQGRPKMTLRNPFEGDLKRWN